MYCNYTPQMAHAMNVFVYMSTHACICDFSQSHFESPFKEKTPFQAWGGEREHAHFLPVDDATKCATTRKKKKKPQLQYYITDTLT